MADNLTIEAKLFLNLADNYGAPCFQDILADYIAYINYPGTSELAWCKKAADILILFYAVPVFQRIKFIAHNGKSKVVDSVHMQLKKVNSHG